MLPCPYDSPPYSEASLRYALRMKPFTALSIPEVPSYPDFASRAGLLSSDEGLQAASVINAHDPQQWRQKARKLIEDSSQALQTARRLWNAISKASPHKAQTTHCEDWWRADIKNVQRSCIAANIAIETASKGLRKFREGQSTDLRHALKVEIAKPAGYYHAWWIIPKITAITDGK